MEAASGFSHCQSLVDDVCLWGNMHLCCSDTVMRMRLLVTVACLCIVFSYSAIATLSKDDKKKPGSKEHQVKTWLLMKWLDFVMSHECNVMCSGVMKFILLRIMLAWCYMLCYGGYKCGFLCRLTMSLFPLLLCVSVENKSRRCSAWQGTDCVIIMQSVCRFSQACLRKLQLLSNEGHWVGHCHNFNFSVHVCMLQHVISSQHSIFCCSWLRLVCAVDASSLFRWNCRLRRWRSGVLWWRKWRRLRLWRSIRLTVIQSARSNIFQLKLWHMWHLWVNGMSVKSDNLFKHIAYERIC